MFAVGAYVDGKVVEEPIKKKKNGDERLVRVGSIGMRTGGAGWWDDRGWEKTRRHAQDGLRRERVEERPYG